MVNILLLITQFNTHSIHYHHSVMIYRCTGLANNCGACLELDEKYSCGWCQQTETCEVSDNCKQPSQSLSTQVNSWLNRQQICPNPQILDFFPKTGPLEGGTNLTIEGINLGRNFEDIEVGVAILHEHSGKFVGTIQCIPFQGDYIKTSRIKCNLQNPRNISSSSTSILMGGSGSDIVGGSNGVSGGGGGLFLHHQHHSQLMLPSQQQQLQLQQSNSISGPVVVRIQKEFTAKSRDTFTFVNPRIFNINPSKGPISGGTLLSFGGLNLNAGSRAEAFLGNLPCNVTHRAANTVECITSSRYAPGEEQVRIRFDNGQRNFEAYRFLYVEDPKVLSVESASTGVWKSISRGIPSGGIGITVRGENFNIIQQPQMYVELDGGGIGIGDGNAVGGSGGSEIFTSNCTTISFQELRCESPPVPAELFEAIWSDRQEYIELEYGFIMDGVQSVRQLSTRQDRHFPKFRMYRNPEFQTFGEPDHIKYYRSEYLTINVSFVYDDFIKTNLSFHSSIFLGSSYGRHHTG